MRLYSREIQVSEGLAFPDSTIRRAGSLLITNRSGAYMFLRIGGNDTPRTNASASTVIPPNTVRGIPVTSGLIGAYFTATPTDVGFLGGVASGVCTIEWFTESVTEWEQPLSGSFTTDSRSAIQDTYPYGITGRSKDTNGDFPSIEATGFQAIRFFVGLVPEVLPSAVSFGFTLSVAGPLVVVSFPFKWTMGYSQAATVDCPLPYRSTVGGITVTPFVAGEAGLDTLTVLPILMMGDRQFKTSFSG